MTRPRILPQDFEWYFAIYQLIDVYTINKVGVTFWMYDPRHWPISEDYLKKAVAKTDKVKADLAKRNFESGLKQYSGNSDYFFKSETFEVPTLYFCEKFDPPLK